MSYKVSILSMKIGQDDVFFFCLALSLYFILNWLSLYEICKNYH